MDSVAFEKQYKKKERFWDIFWISLMLICCVVAGWYAWTYAQGGFLVRAFITSIAVFVGMGLFLSLMKPIDQYIRRIALKKYWIEDHSDVIKLFGAVRANDIRHVYREVLNVRPGYKIVDDAYKMYGCTIAAVKATEADLEAKEQLLSMGIKVDRIG